MWRIYKHIDTSSSHKLQCKGQTFVHILASRTTASSKIKRNMVCKYQTDKQTKLLSMNRSNYKRYLQNHYKIEFYNIVVDT